MELRIRNKWITFRGSSVVKNEREEDVLKVQGRFWSIRRRKYICDLDGKPKYMVRNRFWNFFRHAAYVLDPEDHKKRYAKVQTKFWTLHDHLNVECDLGELVVRGNILGFDYHITLNGKEIGHVSRKISLRDSFVLTLDDDQDPYFFTALVIALDNITDARREGSSGHVYDNIGSAD